MGMFERLMRVETVKEISHECNKSRFVVSAYVSSIVIIFLGVNFGYLPFEQSEFT